MQEPELTFVEYQDTIKEWRWRLKAKNGQIIATSGEGYKNHSDCRAMIDKIKAHASSANIV
jgi:uncharacterized protein YegP (UPF0339 family)